MVRHLFDMGHHLSPTRCGTAGFAFSENFIDIVFHMSMNYFLVPNIKTSCEGTFPDGLSFFFEQYERYFETSEVSQISTILGIDLNIFQNIDLVLLTVNEFINKINESPDYYLFVRHIQDKVKPDEGILKTATIKNKREVFNWLDESYKQDDEMFPPDRGFLRKYAIIRELVKLKELIENFEKSDVTKVKLV